MRRTNQFCVLENGALQRLAGNSAAVSAEQEQAVY